MAKPKYAARVIVNDTWILKYEIKKGKGNRDMLEILEHSDKIKLGDDVAKELPKFSILEGRGRIAHAVTIKGKQHRVVNPKHVLGYGDKE